MNFDVLAYTKMLSENNISILYIGPLWADGIDGLADFLQRRLDKDDMPLTVSRRIFSVFVEQVNNMCMYSVDEYTTPHEGQSVENNSCPHTTNTDCVSSPLKKGAFILGNDDKSYFLQTGNVMKTEKVKRLKERLDILNNMDKQQLRQYHKEQLKNENDNAESKGAGLGLTEIARRATSKIEYKFVPYNESDGDLTYFSMYVTI